MGRLNRPADAACQFALDAVQSEDVVRAHGQVAIPRRQDEKTPRGSAITVRCPTWVILPVSSQSDVQRKNWLSAVG